MSSYYRQQLEDYLKTLDIKADRVLDVGAAQQLTKGRIKSWDVQEYKVLDLEQPHKAEHTVDIVWDLNEAIFNDYDENWQIPNKYFEWANIVFCLEVFEYIFDPSTACKNLAHLINPGGTLYISFPFIYPVHQPIENDYLRYTRQGAIKLLEESGFTIDEIIPRTTKEASLRQFYASERMRAAKGYEYHEEIGIIIKAKKL